MHHSKQVALLLIPGFNLIALPRLQSNALMSSSMESGVVTEPHLHTANAMVNSNSCILQKPVKAAFADKALWT